MRNVILSYYFLSHLLVYIVYNLVRMSFDSSMFLDGYLNDYLCFPLVLSLILMETRYVKKDQNVQLPLISIVFLFLYWSAYFEWYLPQHNPRYTADYIDILMYALGCTTFLIWTKQLKLKVLH